MLLRNSKNLNLFSHAIFFLLFSSFLSVGNSLSFDFSSFDAASNSIELQGEAKISDQVIYLTSGGQYKSVGRAIYSQPLLLRDSVTGEVTNFTTNFSFNITGACRSDFCTGDGLSFFLSPYPCSSVPNNSYGYALGLFSSDLAFDSSRNHLVAVEIDTYPNPWDPYSYHVGIDVNRINSTGSPYINCTSGIIGGQASNATITYRSSTKILSVDIMYHDNLADPSSTSTLSLSHVVDLSKVLPDKVAIGFSASTGIKVELHAILSWDFSSTLLPPPAAAPAPDLVISSSPPPKIHNAPATAENNSNSTRTSKIGSRGKRNSNTKLIVILVSSIGALTVVGGMGWLLRKKVAKKYWQKMAKKHTKEQETVSVDSDELENGKGPKRFSFDELAAATNNFAKEGKLGEGGFGMVYKGLLNGEEVAVKRVSKGSNQGKKEYISEVTIISQLRHRNLVQLVGWCHDKGDFLLAYKFMPNGSLDSHLHNGRSFLTWPMRYEIAKQLACALRYLHEGWVQCVVHRDVKPSNVMLDSAFNVKLGDFGLARLVDHEISSRQRSTVIAGTLAYMAPEIFDTGRATKESDVYSFGVVALEIACGRKPAEPGKPKLLELMWELYGKGMILEAADERLKMNFDEKEMERLMVVGLWCAHPYLNLRPSIRRAISVLNLDVPLPDLPLEMPVSLGSRLRSGPASAGSSSSAMNSLSTRLTANSSNPSVL